MKRDKPGAGRGDEHQRRLAEALRANLRRRKASPAANVDRSAPPVADSDETPPGGAQAATGRQDDGDGA